MDTVNQQSVEDLLGGAQADGVLSNQSMSSLIVSDIGQQIAAGLGVSVNNISSPEVVLVSILADDSSSIYHGNNVQNIIDGHNMLLTALRGSTQGDSVLIHTKYLNGTILYPYVQLDQAIEMDTNNYHPDGGTPLYDQIAVMAGTAIAKVQDFVNNGIQAKSIFLTCSDGSDQHSRRYRSPESLNQMITDMIAQENFIVAGMGISDGHTDFTDIFSRMGIPSQWILTSANDAHSLRSAWQMISKSATRISQSSAAFSSGVLGGFEL